MSLFDAFLLNALRNTLEDDDDEDIVSSVSRTDRYSFHFKHSGLISLSSDKRTAERRFQLLSAGNGIVFSDQPLRDNEVFEVSVDKLVPPLFGGSDITLDIGVTSLNPSSMNLPRTMTDLATGTWMLSGDQVVRNEVIIKRRYCQDLKTLSVGDRIGVSKTENGSLHFFINGKHQGLAASRLPQEVFAVVDLYARCTKVSIVSPGGPPSVSNSLVSKVLTNKEDELRRYHQQRQWLQECRIVTFPLWFMKNIASSEIEKRELFLFVRSYAHILGHDTFTCDGCGEKFRNRELHYYCMECEDLDLCESCFKSKKCPKDHKLDHKLSKMGWYCDGNNCCRRITGTRFHCLVCEDFDLCLGCQETKNWPARHKESHSMTKSSTLVVQGASLNAGTSYQQAERPRPIPTPTTKTTPATTTCNYRKQCESFLETLNISDDYFDKTPEYNKCFCDSCHKARGDKECYTRGNPPKTYALPLGWSRFAIKIGPHGKVLNIFENWHVAFHGTQAKYLQPIFNNGLQLLMPGDVAFGGSKLREGEGHYNDSWKPHGFDTKQIFVSPSVKYAGCAVYSKKISFTDPKTRKESIAQVALQVLIRPGSYNVGRTTVERSQPFDSNFSDNELEWSTKERGAIIVTGLLIKVS
ncbi:neuralized-like protein 4 isoform X2 [Xenia sp. Carnegie-2017]|uniref:neuralized-like protein 4 isoform X2 n=1 Tax=Xenia sp. Carnegie-2017 TaxID=2897299 RepID=UPI001F04A767|nr:neuralized-like protein 4 isoform X2 [Xenia sp. Carnegie-2017]